MANVVIIILAVSPLNFCQGLPSLLVLAVTICSGRHYLFWPSLFVLAVTICEQKLNGESAKIIMTTFALQYVSYFLYGEKYCLFTGRSKGFKIIGSDKTTENLLSKE